MQKDTVTKVANIVVVDQKRKRITVILHDTAEIILIPYEEIVITNDNRITGGI